MRGGHDGVYVGWQKDGKDKAKSWQIGEKVDRNLERTATSKFDIATFDSFRAETILLPAAHIFHFSTLHSPLAITSPLALSTTMRQFSPILCHMCHLDRQSNVFRSVKALKYPKFTIHHSTTSHVCLITDNDSVRVEFSSVNLYDVEKVAGHNVVLLRVKQLRTYYHIDITRYYLLFGSEHHANVFFETISKLVHAPRAQGEAFAPPMSLQTHPAYPLVLDPNDEVVAEDPSNAPHPPQLNESAEEAMMPFQRMIRDPSVAPIRRGPVRVIRAPPEMRQLRGRVVDTPVNDVVADEENQASPSGSRQQSASVNGSPEAVPPPRKRGRPPKKVAAASSQRVTAVSSQKKLKSILKSASQPVPIVESTRRSARLRDKTRLQYDAATRAPVLDSGKESEAFLGTSMAETTVRATSEAVDRNFSPDSSPCCSDVE